MPGLTKNNGTSNHSYKMHGGVDCSGLITRKGTTAANVHDSQRLERPIAHQRVVVVRPPRTIKRVKGKRTKPKQKPK